MGEATGWRRSLKTQQPAGVPTSRMTGGRQEASAGEGAAREAGAAAAEKESSEVEWIEVEG